jgi:hypothetical protein
MLYAEITLEQYPPGWEELEWKMRKLKQLDYSYSFQVGRQAFGYGMGPKYQFTLIRWERVTEGTRREVLYEGHDYYAVLGFVSMLLTAEEEKR